MSRSRDDTPQIPSDELTAEMVSTWLRRHPDFMEKNPEILAFLTPPKFKRGERILDMQQFMLDRVQKELADLRRREKKLIQTVEGNAAGQSKIHNAVISIVETADIHALSALIRAKLPAILDLEAAVLCIEQTGALALAGANVIGAGGISNMLGREARVLLQNETSGETLVFGDEAERVRSVAFLRLRTIGHTPEMLLALGSGRDDGFDPRQATDLILFLADILEARLKQCLGPKN